MLLRLGGKPISGVDDLHRLLIADLAGIQQPVEILRAGRLVTRTVTQNSKPNPAAISR